MFRKWKTVTVTASVSAIMLLGVLSAPHAAELHNGCANSHTTVASATNAPLATANEAATAPQKQQKSVLDAEALESPLSYFKDAASPEDEGSDVNVRSGAVVLALKALVATLLSTII